MDTILVERIKDWCLLVCWAQARSLKTSPEVVLPPTGLTKPILMSWKGEITHEIASFT